MNNFHKNDWFRKLLNTAFREKPPRCSRMGALILLPSLNPPFREKPPRCSRKGAAIPAPPPLRERRRSLQAKEMCFVPYMYNFIIMLISGDKQYYQNY